MKNREKENRIKTRTKIKMKKQKLFEWARTYLAIEAPVMVGTEKLEGVLPPPDIETERSRKRK